MGRPTCCDCRTRSWACQWHSWKRRLLKEGTQSLSSSLQATLPDVDARPRGLYEMSSESSSQDGDGTGGCREEPLKMECFACFVKFTVVRFSVFPIGAKVICSSDLFPRISSKDLRVWGAPVQVTYIKTCGQRVGPQLFPDPNSSSYPIELIQKSCYILFWNRLSEKPLPETRCND